MNYSSSTAAIVPKKPPVAASSEDGDANRADMNIRYDIYTPPPHEDSMGMMQPTCSPSSGKVQRSMYTSPPPLKRRRHNIVHENDSGSIDHYETPSPESILIDLNSGLSLLHDSSKPSRPRAASMSIHQSTTHQEHQEPQEQEGSASACRLNLSGRSPFPVLSLGYDGDDEDDAELASYFPRNRLEMRASRQYRRYAHQEHRFIPIQDDPCEEEEAGK